MASKNPCFDQAKVKALSQQKQGLILSKTKAQSSFPTFTSTMSEARRMKPNKVFFHFTF
jgi:hypothetical protein